MHSMSPACTRREAKRHQTALRLQQCALRLTAAKGFDGWTMDDLAAEADVSRRTVFNYFDTKADVVLGPPIELADERVTTFVAGGPTGNLLEDVLELAADLIEEHAAEQETAAASREAILGDHRLLLLVHERFEAITDAFVEHLRTREGDAFDPDRARLIGRLIVMVFDSALERAEADPTRPFPDHFAVAVNDARAIFA